MPNISSVTNYFPTVAESSVGMTLSTTIAPGAATVGVSNLSNYANGEFVVFTIDAATPTLKQVFTGQVSGSNIINVVWTYGTNQAHTTGATIIDYVSATTLDMITAGILKQHTQAGAHIGLTNTGGATFTGGITTDSLTISGQNTTAGWNPVGQTITYSANNGAKEFVVTSPSNLTTSISVGMKFQVTRNTVPPTQCMAFASGSSQYATKASPTGITFTTAFTCEAWVYLQSYTGIAQTIISRRSASTSGWDFTINSTGQVSVLYFDGSSNLTLLSSYQSLPLNQWVHIAGVITSVSSKTGAIYINGAAVPSTFSNTAAASLTQAGNLSVGGYGAGTAEFLNGYVSEARVWSVAQSAANIQANMAINCLGTETNLVCLIPGGGNFNDLTTNANNLTATGGAVATQANNPYNAIEYANVRAISYSNPTTTLTLFTSDAGTIPNETLTSPQYSTSREPYGLPDGLNTKIMGQIIWAASQTSTATSTGTQLTGATMTMTIPAGGKKVVIKAYCNTLTPAAGTAVVDGYWGSSQVGRVQGVAAVNSTAFLQSMPFWATAGSQTFSLDMWESSTGTSTFTASTGNPAWFTVEEV